MANIFIINNDIYCLIKVKWYMFHEGSRLLYILFIAFIMGYKVNNYRIKIIANSTDPLDYLS